MKILLDTHIYLWSIENNEKLSKRARELMLNAELNYVSSVSIWELSIKISKGKYPANIDLLIDGIEKSGFKELPLVAKYAKKVATLPHHHGDPFDRMLIAQALCEPLQFLTADKSLQEYSDLVMVI